MADLYHRTIHHLPIMQEHNLHHLNSHLQYHPRSQQAHIRWQRCHRHIHHNSLQLDHCLVRRHNLHMMCCLHLVHHTHLHMMCCHLKVHHTHHHSHHHQSYTLHIQGQDQMHHHHRSHHHSMKIKFQHLHMYLHNQELHHRNILQHSLDLRCHFHKHLSHLKQMNHHMNQHSLQLDL